MDWGLSEYLLRMIRMRWCLCCCEMVVVLASLFLLGAMGADICYVLARSLLDVTILDNVSILFWLLSYSSCPLFAQYSRLRGRSLIVNSAAGLATLCDEQEGRSMMKLN